MSKRLENKVAIITGGATGIGKASAKRFLEEGAKVVIADTNEILLQRTVDELRETGKNILGISADITKVENVKGIVKKTLEFGGKIHVLFNNAGLNHAALLHETTLEDWEKVFSVNVKSMFLMCKEVLPVMIENRYGSIINTASSSAPAGSRGIAAYFASKGAVPAMTRSIAIDYAPYNIRANFICPGMLHTEMEKEDPHQIRYRTACPLGRLGEPVEIANAAVFLASDEATFMTGASIVIDGGLTK